MSLDVRELAEYPNAFIPVRPGSERIDTGRYALCLTPREATVQRQRFPVDELDEVLAEVRALLRERGRSETQWEVGTDAAGLVAPLLARGLARDEDPVSVAMALRAVPLEPPPGVRAERVDDLEGYIEAVRVQSAAFGHPADAARIALARAEWDPEQVVMHVVRLDGQIVCAGRMVPVPGAFALFGGATRPQDRGRGAYRAMIAARWAHAVEAGAPCLVTQAGSMSRPILERLGFEPVGRVEMLRDRLPVRARDRCAEL